MFPYQLYNKINGYTPTQQQQQTNNAIPSSNSHVSMICRKIASAAIKSARSTEEPVKIEIPKITIPKEWLLYGSIVLGKIAMFAIYQKAAKHGLSDAMDI